MTAARGAALVREGEGPAGRRIVHPGTPDRERIDGLSVAGRAFSFRLEPGASLVDALTRPVTAAGFDGAAVTFEGAGLGPMTYLTPALADEPGRLFAYGGPWTLPGRTRIALANATVGWRDGRPFVHCHGTWTEAGGRRVAAHIVPEDTVVAEGAEVRAWGVRGAAMDARPDEETRFTLFGPRPSESAAGREGDAGLVLARIKPNEDICQAVEALCRRHGLREAEMRGSLGSLVGARFEAGGMDDVGSEVLVERGRIAPDESGELRAAIDIVTAGFSGDALQGRLLRGRNPVCVTFEVMLEGRR